ncbi:MAG: PAS domain S-box protein [Cyclobacteriaceae bacterium]
MNGNKLIELSRNMVCTFDIKGHFTFVNPAFCKIMGYTQDEIVIKKFIELVHSEDVEKSLEAFNGLQKGQAVIDFKHRFLHKDGSILHISWNGYFIPDENSIYAIGNNISERVEAQAKLQRSSQLLEASQSLAGVGGWEVDIASGELFWTAETYRIHDTTPEEFDPTVDAGVDCYLPESREIILDALKLAMEQGKGYDLELQLKTTKDRFIHVRTTCEVTIHNGKPMKLTGAFQDITKQKVGEIFLKASEEKLSNAFENVPTPNSIINLKTGERIAVNFAFCQTFGYSRSELINKSIFDINLGEKPEVYDLIVSSLRAKGKLYRFAFKAQTKTGEQRQVLLNASKLYPDNNDIFITSFLDITELKEKEKELIQSEAYLKKVQGLSKVGSWYMDLKSKGVNWTKELYEMFGLDLSLPAPSLPEQEKMYTKDSWELLLTSLDKTVKEGVPYELELEIIKKDQPNGWIWTRGEVLIDEQGEIYGLYGAAQNITFQKTSLLLAQEEKNKAQESENYLNSIINAAGDPLFVTDDRSRLLLVNDAFCKIFNTKEQEVLGKTLTEFETNKEREESLEMDRQVLATGKESIIEETLSVKGKVTKIISTRKTRYIDASGQQYLVGTIHDLTERKKLENELSKSLEKSSLAVKAAKLGVWTLELSPEYFDWNDELLNIYDLTQAEFQADNNAWKNRIHPDDLTHASEHLNRLLGGEPVSGVEFRIIRKDGKIRHLEVSGTPVYNNANELVQIIGINRDVSHIIDAKEELKTSEEKFSRAFENAPNPTSILNFKTGERLAVNNAFCETFGYSKAELLKENFLSNNISETPSGFKDFLNTIFAEGKADHFPLTMRAKSGDIRTVLINSTKLNPSEDDVYITTFIDVTEQKKFELEIIKLSTAIEQSPESIVITDIDGFIEYANPSFSVVSGYSLSEAIGKKPGILQSGQHHKKFYENLWNTISSGNIWHGEFYNKKKNGELYWESASISPLKNKEGVITNYVAIKEDITEKKRILSELKKAKERAEDSEIYLNSIIRNIGDPLFVKDDQSRIQLVNNAFCELFELKKEDILGQTLAENISPEEMEQFLSIDKAVLETGKESIVEESLTVNDHETRTIFTRKNRYIDSSGRKLLIGTIRDLTELKKYRDQLEELVSERTSELEFRTEELRSANTELKQAESKIRKAYVKEKELGELKSRFVSTASHQFRTPLTVIQSNVELMEMYLDKLPPEIKQRFLKSFERITKESSRMTALMNDVLILGKLNSGALTTSPKWIDVAKVVQDMTTRLNEIERIPAKINLEIINKPHEVYLDESQFNHILNNVLGNAQKYSLDRGNVEFQVFFDQDQVSLMVKDQGIGMSEEDVRNIFQPFTRGHNTEGIQGTGLGMSIVHEYIDLNKGKIKVESQLNVGTTVEIIFNIEASES